MVVMCQVARQMITKSPPQCHLCSCALSSSNPMVSLLSYGAIRHRTNSLIIKSPPLASAFFQHMCHCSDNELSVHLFLVLQQKLSLFAPSRKSSNVKLQAAVVVCHIVCVDIKIPQKHAWHALMCTSIGKLSCAAGRSKHTIVTLTCRRAFVYKDGMQVIYLHPLTLLVVDARLKGCKIHA